VDEIRNWRGAFAGLAMNLDSGYLAMRLFEASNGQ
jgi:hypothetical protein